MLQWALRYRRLGLSVIPLRVKGKEPLIPWIEFQQRLATEDEIRKWWNAVPNANIGIVTGSITRLCVVDLDGPEGLASASELGLTSGLRSGTGKGAHLWYKHPGTNVQNAVRQYPGIDIRGDGGYVLAAPSIHPNSRRYRWLSVLNAQSFSTLPLFPTAMFASTALPQETSKKEEGWIAKALEDMKDGNIDNTLVSILGRLRSDGYSAEDARAFLEPHVRRVGAEAGHLEAKIENIWSRYEPDVNRIQRRNYGMDEQSGLTIHTPSDNDSWEQFEHSGTVETNSLRTGYRALDSLLANGFKSERLFTVAALTGHGKTNFGIGLSTRLCEAGKRVLYFSTEFSYKKIWQRYIAALKDPARFREHAFHVCDGFTPSLEQVEEALIRIKPDVFIFDYIQHVSKEKEHLTAFMKGCQFFQRKYNTQGVILAQLNRSADWVEDGKRVQPRMSMIEGSATIEQASSRVLLLSMSKVLPEMNEIIGVLDKNDDGDTGIMNFGLYKNPYRLEELP